MTIRIPIDEPLRSQVRRWVSQQRDQFKRQHDIIMKPRAQMETISKTAIFEALLKADEVHAIDVATTLRERYGTEFSQATFGQAFAWVEQTLNNALLSAPRRDHVLTVAPHTVAP